MSDEGSDPKPEHEPPPVSGGVLPRRSKPASLWIAQILFTFNVMGFCFAGVTAQKSNVAGALFSFLLAVGLAYLTLAVQRRETWSHTASSAVLAVICVMAIARQFMPGFGAPIEIPKEDRMGAMIGGALGCVLFVALVARVTFGKAAREYFLPPT
jgi:hypothetical protein